MNKYNFSNRMKALASFVIEGESVADIGTDHGFVPIYLLAENIVPFAVMTDINAGPLEKAKGNLDRVGILPQFYSLRKGDGLDPVSESEVSSIIIAGMGAETIINILSWDINKTKSYKRLILQPRKRTFMLRKWLNENGFIVNREKLVLEDEKICEILVAEKGAADSLEDIELYLPKSIRTDELFPRFLDEFISKTEIVINNMANSESTAKLVKPWQDRLKKAKEIKNERSSN